MRGAVEKRERATSLIMASCFDTRVLKRARHSCLMKIRMRFEHCGGRRNAGRNSSHLKNAMLRTTKKTLVLYFSVIRRRSRACELRFYAPTHHHAPTHYQLARY